MSTLENLWQALATLDFALRVEARSAAQGEVSVDTAKGVEIYRRRYTDAANAVIADIRHGGPIVTPYACIAVNGEGQLVVEMKEVAQ